MTKDAIDRILFCVKRIEDGTYNGCPGNHSINSKQFPGCGFSRIKLYEKDVCGSCWKTACLSYIYQNAPKNFEVGDEVMFVKSIGKISAGEIGIVISQERGWTWNHSVSACEIAMKKNSEYIVGLDHDFSFVRRISDPEDEAGFRFGDVVEGAGQDDCDWNGDETGVMSVVIQYDGLDCSKRKAYRVLVLNGANKARGGSLATDISVKKIGHVSCSEETLRHLIDEKNVSAIKAMIKLDKPNETKEDKPMEINVYIDGSEFTDEAMRKAVEKAVTENMPKRKTPLEYQQMREELSHKLWEFAMENGGVPKDGENYYAIERKTGTRDYAPMWWIQYGHQGAVRFYTHYDCQRAIDEVLKPYLAAHPDFEW